MTRAPLEYSLTDIPGLGFHDPAFSATFLYRGNISVSTSSGSVRNYQYDIAGNVLSADDGHGHSVSSSFSTATQYTAPDAIAPAKTLDLFGGHFPVGHARQGMGQ